jgi:hypothetical protein
VVTALIVGGTVPERALSTHRGDRYEMAMTVELGQG